MPSPLSGLRAPIDTMTGIEKQQYRDDPSLPTYDSSYEPAPPHSTKQKTCLRLLGLCLVGAFLTYTSLPVTSHTTAPTAQSVCQQSPILTPRGNVTDLYAGGPKQRIIDWLSGAVQVPTEAYDDMIDVDGDARFKVFGAFHDCSFACPRLIASRADPAPVRRPRREIPAPVRL